MFRKIFSIIVCILVPSLPAKSEIPNIQPGLWEVTVIAEGLSTTQQTSKAMDCITQEQIDNPSNLVPKNSQCRSQEKTLKNNLFTWEERCDDNEGMISNKGSLEFYGDHYRGKVKVSSKTGDIQLTINAKRLGECK